MNSKLERKYFVIRTNSNDAIGLLSLLVPINDASTFEFSLHNPTCKDKPNECLDLMFTDMDFAEYETHRDAFETYDELVVVQIWTPALTGMPTTVLVKKKDEDNEPNDAD